MSQQPDSQMQQPRRRRLLLSLGILGLALAAYGYFVFMIWLRSLPDYTNGEVVRQVSAARACDFIWEFDVDEDNGRLVAVTSDQIRCYRYPSLERVRSRPLSDLPQSGPQRRAWLLPHAIVVKNDKDEVYLLDPETLKTITHLEGEYRSVATDPKSSTLVLVQSPARMDILRVGEGGVLQQQTVPFPNAAKVQGLIVLPSGRVVFSTGEPGLQQLRPPYKAAERVAGSTLEITHLECGPTAAFFIAYAYPTPAVEVWDVVSMTKSQTVWPVLSSNAEGRELRLDLVREKGARPAERAVERDVYLFPPLALRYNPERRLFVMCDPFPKDGTVLFVSASSLSVLDRIKAHQALNVKTYLSTDGARVVTAGGDGIRLWDIPKLPRHADAPPPVP